MKQVIVVIVVVMSGCYILFMPSAYGDDKALRIKPTEGITPSGEKWAILIGIDKYDDMVMVL